MKRSGPVTRSRMPPPRILEASTTPAPSATRRSAPRSACMNCESRCATSAECAFTHAKKWGSPRRSAHLVRTATVSSKPRVEMRRPRMNSMGRHVGSSVTSRFKLHTPLNDCMRMMTRIVLLVGYLIPAGVSNLTTRPAADQAAASKPVAFWIACPSAKESRKNHGARNRRRWRASGTAAGSPDAMYLG